MSLVNVERLREIAEVEFADLPLPPSILHLPPSIVHSPSSIFALTG